MAGGRSLRPALCAGALSLAMYSAHGTGTGIADLPVSWQPFIGAWGLDAHHSHWAGAAPKGMTIVLNAEAGQLHYLSLTDFPGGGRARAEYSAVLDDLPVPVVGSSGFLAPVSLHQVDGTHIRATYLLGLRPIAWSDWEIVAGGSELRIRTQYLDRADAKHQNVAIFRKRNN